MVPDAERDDDSSCISCNFDYINDNSTISTILSEDEVMPLQRSKFAPQSRRRSVEEQVGDLTDIERNVYDSLRLKWSKRLARAKTTKRYSDEMILRFARNSNGLPFTYRTARSAMDAYNERFLRLNANSLANQLLSKTLFPVPGLQTYGKGPVLYMKPARYFPKQTPTKDIIDNLVYCMTTMAEDEATCRKGITFMALMDEWQIQNFCVDYCKQFMDCLQGKGGLRVNLFLIVNPPSWFGKVWAIMRPMLSESFRKRVKIIPESAIDQFLKPGFCHHLPDDFKRSRGRASTEGLVEEFLDYRISVESEQPSLYNQWLWSLPPKSEDSEACENAALRWSAASSSNGKTCTAPPQKPRFGRFSGTGSNRWLSATVGHKSLMNLKRNRKSSSTCNSTQIAADVAPRRYARHNSLSTNGDCSNSKDYAVVGCKIMNLERNSERSGCCGATSLTLDVAPRLYSRNNSVSMDGDCNNKDSAVAT